MTSISFAGNTIYVDGRRVALSFPIKEAFALGKKVIVLFDPDSNLGKHGQFRNLIALTSAGEHLWTAELPTDKSSDVYYRVVSQTPLKADSFCSFECLIDPDTGKILRKEFYK